jgi:RNA polymerase sigma-70 factor (ECF subfamily)
MSSDENFRSYFAQTSVAAAQDEVRQQSLAISAGLKRQDAGLIDELIVCYQHRLMRYLLYLTSNRGPFPGGLDARSGARRTV